MSTNNNQTTGSNFKRQNTVDAATIKANNESRMSGNTPSSRPSTGGLSSNTSSKTPAVSSGDNARTPTSPKNRGITKSNTMSNATGRGVASLAAANRRSAIDPGLKSTSSDKTNALDGDSLNSRYVVSNFPPALIENKHIFHVYCPGGDGLIFFSLLNSVHSRQLSLNITFKLTFLSSLASSTAATNNNGVELSEAENDTPPATAANNGDTAPAPAPGPEATPRSRLSHGHVKSASISAGSGNTQSTISARESVASASAAERDSTRCSHHQILFYLLVA